MADLPTHHEIEKAIREGDNYEHPEPHAPAGGCSNLGDIPHDIATTEDTEY